jgi:hypothetical protein|tara:strand:- start:78 stop:812 length:735 start_codon:yes stop_codon:yes gene_type:complete
MKKNKLTLKESELVDLIEKIAKQTKDEQIQEQGLKKQIRKSNRAKRKGDEATFKTLSNELLTTNLVNDDIEDVDYKKYPKLNELSKLTLMKQTIESATALYIIHSFYNAGETCEERQDNFNLDGLDDFLNKPLNVVYGGMESMSKEIPGGVLRRTVSKFIKKAEKLINMLYDHKTAQKHFKEAGLENPMDQWAKINTYKATVSENATDLVTDMVYIDCATEEVVPEKESKLARLFKGKRKSFEV